MFKFNPNYSLSFSDLMTIPAFKDAIKSNNEKLFKEVLYSNGMEVAMPIEEITILHRNLQNKVVECPRYEGFERIDKDWIATGVASLDAIIASTDDGSLKTELRVMSAQRNQEKVFD
ncbi:hypothetical protein [Pseudomonas phage vB_PseuGesM_254]|uniref:Uncharacterized protein n=1 Tax=Pseudomonas phage vB_PseuGesM_254 TaxID=3092638 RepID=A0AAX4G6K4_9CAUD|nr:hypothetical protein [Pseudomonas phage PseuGes_254]